MAFFKILKGKSGNLPANKNDGWCYITTDNHKFYIDYKKDDGTTDRFALNASYADSAGTANKLTTPRTISLSGSVTGSGAFDGSNNLNITTTTNHTHNYAGSSSAGGVATSSYSLQNKGTLDTQEKIDNFLTANQVQYATFKTDDSNNVGMASNDGMILSLPWGSTTYGAQIAFDDIKSGLVKVRGKSGDWGDWYALLHSGNYTNYTVKKDGAGASGTWGINVTGSAGSVDWSNVANKPSTFIPSSHTHDYLPLSGGTMAGTIITPGNDSIVIRPAKNNYDIIGSPDYYYYKIYSTNFYGSLSGNASSASKVNNKLIVGSKTYDGSAAVTIAASDLGLASAMLFLGTSSTVITDGATTNPITVGGASKTVTAGNVVLYGSKEFVWTGSAWEELGNEGSYKIVQSSVADPSASGTSNSFIATISQNTNGEITVTKKTVAVTNSAPTLSWGTTSTVGIVAGTSLSVTMPANPNTDYRVLQTAINASDYTNWRPLIWGSSNSGTEGFTPSTVTDRVYTAQTISCQPSSGTIKATTFKGSLNGNALSASKLATARTISLTGSVTGSGSFDGSGNLSIATTTNHSHNYLFYPSQLTSDSAIDSFNGANIFQVTTWNNTSSPGVSNGIILNMGWGSTSYGAQIAVDDDPTYFIALRQRDGNGWKSWKRIPMGDGTGASGTWPINISGNSITCNGTKLEWSGSIDWNSTSWIAAWNSDGTLIKALNKNSFAPASHSHSYLPLSGGTLTGYLSLGNNSNTSTIPAAGIRIPDLRECTPVPGMFGDRAFNIYFDQAATGDWQSIMHVKGWNGNYVAYELAGPASTTNYNQGLYYRAGVSGSWQCGWKKLWMSGDAVTGAVWNDYAECRESDCEEFGYVLAETGDDTLTKTTERLQPFAGVSSDTWGFSQGETARARTPIAVAGRVLVYPYQDRNNYKPGDCVCAAPGGTVDIMTREEVREWPDRIVGTVSCVPTYEEWGGGEGADREPVKVNGRIWIKVV